MKTPDINGKTPEEIKKGIANAVHVKYLSWPDENTGERRTLYGVAIGYVLRDEIFAYIQQLESRLAQAERERDAAIGELPHNCWNCIYHLDNPIEEIDTEGRTIHCYCTADVCYPEDNSSWQWRGVCPANTKEDAE